MQFNKYLLILLHVVFLSIFYFENSFAQNATASFSSSGSSAGCAPLNIQFTNNSTNAVSYFWDFGNGNTSTLANPTIAYLNPGNYSVKLVAYATNGSADSLTRNNYIIVVQKPYADFSSAMTATCIDNQISFTNISQNFDSCLWDFGDGTTSYNLNPVHTYTASGQFTVTLMTFKNPFGCSDIKTKSQYITIHPKPVTNFSVNQTSTCNPSQLFSFTSNSANANSWAWNFGDGTTSNLQNPNHTYSTSGIYTVSLITGNGFGCQDTLVRTNYISVLNNPAPQISITDSAGCAPLAVNFSTAPGAASYLWNAGDGGITSLQNFSHTYYTSGNFIINLSVTYSNGCSNSTIYNSINVSQINTSNYNLSISSGCSPLNVQFNNLTAGTGNSYLWNFGDGTSSTQSNPNHVYTSAGAYQTSLTVSNASGCSNTYSYTIPVSVNNPDAAFNPDVFSGCPPLSVNFASLTPVAGYQYSWNFGDGTSSGQMYPNHIYSTTGNFTVGLTVSDASGCSSTFVFPNPITVSTAQSNFTIPDPVIACAPFNVNFSDASFGSSNWLWNFGDGNSSTQQNPSHTYTAAGTYNVSLNTQTNGSACDQVVPLYSTYIIHDGSADFSYDAELCPPYTAYFHDSSTNAVSWMWNFGDGTTSNQQNPTHIYANPGSYSVSLTITTADGCSYTSIHDYAVNFEPLIASPFAFTNDSVPPLNVQFNANSEGATNWFWDFGDATTSNLEDPFHVFTQPPPYNITLTLSNDSCSVTLTFPNVELGSGGAVLPSDSMIIHQPEPQGGCAPLTLNFHNPVLNTVSWSWDFGDGTTSSLENPVHVYANSGTYSVTLITTKQSGKVDTLFLPASVLVSGIQADFSIIYSNNCIGNAINLVNNSQNAVTNEWNFGDGSTSYVSNPLHVYTNVNSNYVISLRVTSSEGCADYLTKSFYGSVNNAISANKRKMCANDTIFFNSSILSYASYSWDFGDGMNSAAANPFHIYSDTGTYFVVLNVTDTSGCNQSFNLPYTIEVFNPVASFNVSNITSNCVGVTYYFNNTSANSDSWIWDFGDGTTSSLQNPSHFYNVPGNYNVTLTAFKNNCSNIMVSPNVVFVPNRVADFSYVKSSDCLPVTVDFTDLSTDAVTWYWDFGDGTMSQQQNPSHVYTAKPVSNVTLYITDIYGCQTGKTRAVINPTIASASLIKIEGCKPLTVSFGDSSLNAVSWFWNFGDGMSASQANPAHVYQNPGIYDVQLIVSSSSGCSDTLRIDSLVTVGGSFASFTTNLQTGCSPAVVDFTDNSINASTYLWNFGDSSFSTLQNPSHIYAQPGNYTVTAIVSDSIGCSDTLQMQNMINVRGPVAAFSISGSQGCAPFSVQFNNLSLNASDWFWSFGDGDSSAILNPNHDFMNPGSYIVSLITHDTSGCESVFTYPDTIYAFAKPSASFNISDTVGCAPLNVAFTNTSAGGSVFQWNFGDGTTASQTSATHNYPVAGVYDASLIATSQEGCSDTMQYRLNIYNRPAADFAANTLSGCAPLPVGFTNLTSLTQNAMYSWDFGNGFTSALQNPVTAYFTPGIYTVTLTVTNNGMCSDTKTKTAYITVYDNSPPAIARVFDVTVTSNTTVDITWANVADPDLYEYKLFRLNQVTGAFDNIYNIVDTNSAGLNVSTTYTDTNLSTLSNVYTYKVQTVDRCNNRVELADLTAHTTMNVTATALGNNIFLSWTPYLGCYEDAYQIYRNDGNGNFIFITAVPPDSNSFLDTTASCPVAYSYKIKATNLCGTPYYSFSDTSAAIPESELGNQFIDVVFSTVEDDRNIVTEWSPPQLAPDKVVQYDIYRSVDQSNYILINSVPSNVLKYTDENADVHHQNYFYKIMIINECDVAASQGKIGSSILLNADYNEADEIVKLRWTKYEGWESGVEKYIIERKNARGIWETLKVVDGAVLETEDK